MDEFVAFSSCALLKVYDDIQDNSITISNLQMESLKVAAVTFITILFLKSQTITIFCILTIFICMYQGAIDSDFWKACIPIPFLTLLVNFSVVHFSVTDIAQKALAFLVLSGFSIGEHKIFKEEKSVRKTIFRSIIVVIIPILIYLTRDLMSFPFIKLIGIGGIGYFGSNLLFQFMWNKASDTEKSNPDSQSRTES